MPTPSTYQSSIGYFTQQALNTREELLSPEYDMNSGSHNHRMEDPRALAPVPHAYKGKERAAIPSDRPSTMFHIGEGRPKEYRSDWMVDEAGARAGADAWGERDRVILVVGRESSYRSFWFAAQGE